MTQPIQSGHLDSAGQLVRFDDQVVVVTGGGFGLGRGHVLLLGERGAIVVVNDVSEKGARQTAADIVATRGRATAVAASIAHPEAAAALIENTFAEFGRLDAVLNNAGVGGPTGPIDTVSDEILHKIVDSHLLGSFYTARAAWPIMVAGGGGRIVFTSSGAAMGVAGSSVYAMAKAGLWGLTRSLAIEGAEHGIVVNAVLPMGYTRAASLNPHEDTRRWMEDHFPPQLTSPAAVLLCHPDAPCTGELISCGGGRVAWVATVGVPGLDRGADLTVENVRDHWDEVVAMEGLQVQMKSRDELSFYRGAPTF